MMPKIAQVPAFVRDKVITEMFWVAEYNNGQALPELDPFTGKVNSFSQVDHKKTIRFWWIPITADMAAKFPYTRVNPRFFTKDGKPNRHWVDLKGSKGFVARRMVVEFQMGKPTGLSTVEQLKKLTAPPKRVKCYVIGIEGGPRQEIYPDGHEVNKPWPDKGETQDILHH
jgi:hypothetical protein